MAVGVLLLLVLGFGWAGRDPIPPDPLDPNSSSTSGSESGGRGLRDEC